MSGPANTSPANTFECINPILRVDDISASLDYYVRVLGFQKADWAEDGATFVFVGRDGCGLYLCQGGQGAAGTWVWVGVEDVEALHSEYAAAGARIRQSPRNYPWALEMQVEDPDGHVLRFGFEPKSDRPFDDF